jgi:hypothetical protein
MAGTLKILVATLRYPPYVAGVYELITAEVVESLRARGHTLHVSGCAWAEPALP